MRTATAAPHCDAIHAAHIARVTVETLVGYPAQPRQHPVRRRLPAQSRHAGRPAGWLTGLAGCAAWRAGRRLARQLRAVALAPGQDAIHACGHYIRESFGLYAGLMRVDRPRTDAPADPLRGMRPRAIVVAIGPGLGIGDEIKLRYFCSGWSGTSPFRRMRCTSFRTARPSGAPCRATGGQAISAVSPWRRSIALRPCATPIPWPARC
ncbi:hypothetical protein WJ970_23585 [Achromobacter xylosoxidans]